MEKRKINNNVLFIFVIILLVVNSYTFVISTKDMITGKFVAEGRTSICIGTIPNMGSPTPNTETIVTGAYTSIVNSLETHQVTFEYYYFGIPQTGFGVDFDSDNDTVFNATLNTSNLPDGNCNYRIIARAYGYCGISDYRGSAIFTVNNIDSPPIWTEFNNSMTTNFSNYTSWVNIPNVVLTVPPYGQVEPGTNNYDSADLDQMFNISDNLITIRGSWSIDNCFDGINHKITFFNVTDFAEPMVLRDGQACDTYCSSLTCNGGNCSFFTSVSGLASFSMAEGGNLSVEYLFNNKTFDNSPTIEFRTYMKGTTKNVSVPATCEYMTDYNPLTFMPMEDTGGINHSHTITQQNWSYLPTNMGHYPYIQHHDYYNGLHTLWLNCSVGYQQSVKNTTFLITYTDRDRVYYSDGDEIRLYLRLEEEGLDINANFSQIDSNFDSANVTVMNNGTDYNISYNISSTNTRNDSQYNITINAYNSTGEETMNGSIFVYLHNIWRKSDIDDAFDCWNFKQGYYFDEVACDWESDVNHVADNVDAFTVEVSCFDTIDNDLDGKIDENDTDCAGIYYIIRRQLGIDSAFLGDPCYNNVCRVCLGAADSNNDGICDTSDGVNVRYLNRVRPGYDFKAKFLGPYINNKSVRVSINFLDPSFQVSNSTSYIQQLPRQELGGCTAGTNCRSFTGTTFGSGLPDRFTGTLNEKLIILLSNSSTQAAYPGMAAGKSIEGSSAFQNLVFFEVIHTAIVNESDDASYCFDDEDNDLNEYYDCFDTSCNLTYNPSNASERCEMPNELTCDDGFDNDVDGFIDCEDNDCFKKNGTNGPCYSIENFNTTSCADSINNEHDWGYRCDDATSISYETRQTNTSYSGTISLKDCLDADCDGQIGNILLGTLCEHCNEKTCDDEFDNDADTYYDCTGNAYRNSYERDCDRWHDLLITCPLTENNCTDNIDNDLDSDSMNGEYSWLSIPVYGGWDCKDMDCDQIIINNESDKCQWGNETECEDDFDNDGDGYTDCYDNTTCRGLSGIELNLTGLCRPCAAIENISVDSCRDYDDNDYDGPTDCSDTDCNGIAGPGTEICGMTEANCTDLIDNDIDGMTDQNDSDCITFTVYPNEFGPGQCSDGLDNDLDNSTDCSDTDCTNTMRCMIGSYTNSCASIGTVGAINVCRTRFVPAGMNLTAGYTRTGLNVGSVVLKAGNIDYPLRNISPVIDDNTSFMTGTITNFVKVNDTYGLKSQNTDGFNGDLAIYLISTTGQTVTPGTYTFFISTSVPGVYGTTTTTTYIAEGELPTVSDINITIGNIKIDTDKVNVTFTAAATDNSTYNSGIAFCTITLEGYFTLNSSTCSYTTNLTSGTYNVSIIAYDGALNPSATYWENFTFTVSTVPVKKGDFYNPYPVENYPEKKHFNDTEMLNIGINFEGGTGFTASDTGCTVELRNRTETVSIQYINLTVIGDEAHCTGQADLSLLPTDPNSTNNETVKGVYYFTVSVNDTSDNKGTTPVEDFNLCSYYYDNSSNKYRCRDACEAYGIGNRAPVLIESIPNQTWPRNTKLSVIDLDDYFMDPDNDPMTFTWTIDTNRINVSMDRSHLITFDPDKTFYGFAYITFYASDLSTTTPSNVVTLEVIFTPQAPPMSIPAGGGGGGGGIQNKTKVPPCEEDWVCTDWTPCLPSGYQTRICRDRNSCGTTDKMPEIIRPCHYQPTCRDRIKNQGEENIDCGGPCPPCATCKDKILNNNEDKINQIMSADSNDISDCGGPLCPPCPTCEDNKRNQGETGIDCGGPCDSCATCKDRVRNQGETNIDCGGPCPPCKIRIEAKAFNWNILLLAASSILLLLLLLLALLFAVLKKKFIRLKARLLNYYMRSMRMFEPKKAVDKELPILQWANSHLDSIEEVTDTKSMERSINAVNNLVRVFFKRIFLIRYAFTDDELMKELEKHKIPTVLRKATEILFAELAQVKYGGENVNPDDVKTLIEQVRVITERYVTEIETKKKMKINISEKDIAKISETLAGAHTLTVSEALKKSKK